MLPLSAIFRCAPLLFSFAIKPGPVFESTAALGSKSQLGPHVPLMMTSPLVTKRVSGEGSTRVANLLKSGKSDEQMVEELFLSSLTRRPNAGEVEVAKRLIAENGQKGGCTRGRDDGLTNRGPSSECADTDVTARHCST